MNLSRKHKVPIVHVRWLHFSVIFKFLLNSSTFDVVANSDFDFSDSEALVRNIAEDNSHEFAIESMAAIDEKVISALKHKNSQHNNSAKNDD